MHVVGAFEDLELNLRGINKFYYNRIPLWLEFQNYTTPNIIFDTCNTWVTLRRNIIYLYSKNPHLDQLFHCQSSRYDVIR